LVLKNYKMAEL